MHKTVCVVVWLLAACTGGERTITVHEAVDSVAPRDDRCLAYLGTMVLATDPDVIAAAERLYQAAMCDSTTVGN